VEAILGICPPLSLNVPEALNILTNICILSPSSPITLILCWFWLPETCKFSQYMSKHAGLWVHPLLHQSSCCMHIWMSLLPYIVYCLEPRKNTTGFLQGCNLELIFFCQNTCNYCNCFPLILPHAPQFDTPIDLVDGWEIPNLYSALVHTASGY
jgi:hypothetical protein